jgi:hypothetical protein
MIRCKNLLPIAASGNRHRLCLDRRMVKTRIYERRRKSEIEFLWVQLEELIKRGKNKDAKTKLRLMHIIYQFLAKTRPKNTQEKKR